MKQKIAVNGLILSVKKQKIVQKCISYLYDTHRDVDRIELCRLKQNYKNIVKTKQRKYEFKRCQDFESLKRSKPRDFWRYFRNKRNCVSSDLPLEDFKLHFESIFSDVNHIPHTKADEFNASHNFDDVNFIEILHLKKFVKQFRY